MVRFGLIRNIHMKYGQEFFHHKSNIYISHGVLCVQLDVGKSGRVEDQIAATRVFCVCSKTVTMIQLCRPQISLPQMSDLCNFTLF